MVVTYVLQLNLPLSITVSTKDFDSFGGGSIPPVATALDDISPFSFSFCYDVLVKLNLFTSIICENSRSTKQILEGYRHTTRMFCAAIGRNTDSGFFIVYTVLVPDN